MCSSAHPPHPSKCNLAPVQERLPVANCHFPDHVSCLFWHAFLITESERVIQRPRHRIGEVACGWNWVIAGNKWAFARMPLHGYLSPKTTLLFSYFRWVKARLRRVLIEKSFRNLCRSRIFYKTFLVVPSLQTVFPIVVFKSSLHDTVLIKPKNTYFFGYFTDFFLLYQQAEWQILKIH